MENLFVGSIRVFPKQGPLPEQFTTHCPVRKFIHNKKRHQISRYVPTPPVIALIISEPTPEFCKAAECYVINLSGVFGRAPQRIGRPGVSPVRHAPPSGNTITPGKTF